MQKLKYLFLLILLLLPAIIVSLVYVILRQPPQYQFHIEDMWKVTLVNTTQTTYNVYLYGLATKSGEGRIVDANTSKFQLPPGTRIVLPQNISPITILNKNTKYASALENTGELPTGDYDVCIKVFNADNGELLGEECITQTVEIINGIELLLPEDKSLVLNGPEETDLNLKSKKEKTGKGGLTDEEALEGIKETLRDVPPQRINNVNGSYITFSWIAPSPAPRGGNLTYTLTLTEMLGNQSAYDAIQSNPAFFKTVNINSTIYQYSSIARNFESGKRYAWKVTAYLYGVKMTESEINEFSYRDNNQQGEFVVRNSPIYHLPSRPTLSQGIESIRELRFNNGTASSLSQTKKSAFQFYGGMSLEGLSSNRQGTGSDLPQRYANLTLTPSVAIYGIPFSTTVLLSTLGTSKMQNVNSFSLGFDPSMLKDMIQEKVEKEIEKAKDKIGQMVKEKSEKYKQDLQKEMLGFNPDTLTGNIDANLRQKIESSKDKIEQKVKEKEDSFRELANTDIKKKTLDNLPKSIKFFTKFNDLGLGTSYPSYTKHTLDGVSVNGLNLSFNPGIFYIAGTGLINQKAIDNVSYKRSLYAGRLGIGKSEKSHFIMTLMHAFDNENSISSTNPILTPKANWLFGIDGKLNLFKDKLTIEGEGVLSMLTRDVRDPDIISDAIPKWVKNIFKPKGSSSADYMYSVKGNYENNKTSTKISAEAKMIGPGFITLGNPTLRNDKLGLEGKIDQKFLDGKISASIAVKNYKDNLLSTKIATTTVTALVFRLGMRFKGLPSLNLTFMPNFQKNNKQVTTTDSSKVDNKTILFTGISGYSFKLGDIRTQTSFLFSYCSSKTFFGIYDYWTKTSQLTQSISFKFPLSISAAIGMVQTSSGIITYDRIITFQFTGDYIVSKMLQVSAGANIDSEKDKNNKLGIYLSSRLQILKHISVDLRAEQNNIKDNVLTTNNYKEFIFRSTISANF